MENSVGCGCEAIFIGSRETILIWQSNSIQFNVCNWDQIVTVSLTKMLYFEKFCVVLKAYYTFKVFLMIVSELIFGI